MRILQKSLVMQKHAIHVYIYLKNITRSCLCSKTRIETVAEHTVYKKFVTLDGLAYLAHIKLSIPLPQPTSIIT